MQINQAKFIAIVEAAKAKAAGDPKWLRAIERAAAGIISGELIVTTLCSGALITTANGTYACDGVCCCEAARHGHKECWHRAGARLMDIYETETASAVSLAADVEASPRQHLIAEIENIWPRFAPGLPLYTELLARFGKSHLDMLDDGALRDIRLAIAI